jgi:hypothetical protein
MTSGLSELRYEVGLDGNIDYVARLAWTQFALANEAPELADVQRLIGQPLLRFIDGEPTREVHRALLSRLKSGASEQYYTFKCDSPTLEREMLMAISRREREGYLTGFVFRSSILSVKEREPIRILGRGLRPTADASPLTICSYCKRVNYPDESSWIPAAAYQSSGGSADVRLSNGVCPDCLKAVVGSVEQRART